MRKLLDEIGPLLAGFQIAVSIVGFFGIGAVAKWILEHWLPFTRWAWTELFSFVNLPDISVQQKDALTTLAFFAPMAVSSLMSWISRKNNASGAAETDIDNADVAKEVRLRIYSALIGATFMVIVGGTVIQDAITLFTTEATPDPTAAEPEPPLDIEAFARIGLLVSVLVLFGLISVGFYWISRRNRVLQARTDKFFEWLGKNAKPIKKAVSHVALSTAASILSSIMSLVSFAATFGGIAIAAGELGVIRTASPLLVLVSLLATVFLNPARLLKTAGVVIALVIASLGWDAAVYIVRAVENAPT